MVMRVAFNIQFMGPITNIFGVHLSFWFNKLTWWLYYFGGLWFFMGLCIALQKT